MDTRVEQYLIEQAFEDWEALNANREYRPVRLSEKDLRDAFGREGLRTAKANVKEYNIELKQLDAEIFDLMVGMAKEHLKTETTELWLDLYNKKRIRQGRMLWIENQLKRLKRFIDSCSRADDANTITPDDIARAKEVPITDYLDFSRGRMAQCLWHGEKTGSMHYYPQQNRIKCFGCDKSADVIDVVMQQNEIEFIPAVKLILGRNE